MRDVDGLCARDDHILVGRVIHAVIQAKQIILILSVLSGLYHKPFSSALQNELSAIICRLRWTLIF